MRLGLTALVVAGALAGLFVTASRSPAPPTQTIRSYFVSFNPHDGPVLKVKVRGGSCSFSLSARDEYLYQCDYSGNQDPTTRAIALARPRLRQHGLCVTRIFGLGGSAQLIHKCGKPLLAGEASAP